MWACETVTLFLRRKKLHIETGGRAAVDGSFPSLNEKSFEGVSQDERESCSRLGRQVRRLHQRRSGGRQWHSCTEVEGTYGELHLSRRVFGAASSTAVNESDINGAVVGQKCRWLGRFKSRDRIVPVTK